MDDTKSISYPLSGGDIKKALDNKVKLITYSDLMQYDNIFDVLKPYNKVVILFETTARLIGHYCCLFKCNSDATGESIIFYDPYGIKPEKQLSYAPDWLIEVTNAKNNLLYRLFQQNEIPIRYSQYDMQKWSKKVSTCGRWCIVRLMYPQFDENEFYQMFKKNSPKKYFDKIVVELTNKLF
jgi:hypothetical protein